MNTHAKFEKEIRQILKGKLKGYKTLGGIGGGLIGYGVGGSKGLYDAIEADRDGEMEGLGKADKAKEYLKRVMAPGAVGLGVGALGGIGVGAAARNLQPMIKTRKNIAKLHKAFDHHPPHVRNEITESILRDEAKNTKQTDLMAEIKNVLKSKLSKKAYSR